MLCGVQWRLKASGASSEELEIWCRNFLELYFLAVEWSRALACAEVPYRENDYTCHAIKKTFKNTVSVKFRNWVVNYFL